MRPTGASIIDHVLGGYPPGLPLVIAGPSGSGRTVLGLQLANSALERGEVVQIVSSEPAQSLMHQADALGFEFDAALAEDRLVLLELDASTPSLVIAWTPVALALFWIFFAVVDSVVVFSFSVGDLWVWIVVMTTE